MTINLLFDPSDTLHAVTAINEVAGLCPGDQVTLACRVERVEHCDADYGQSFHLVVLAPAGCTLTVDGQPLHLETEVALVPAPEAVLP